MKKAGILLLVICILCSAAGCSLAAKEKGFSVENYQLSIVADDTYREKTGGSFDLQITNDLCYISIMAFYYEDLPLGVTPLDVYDIQNEDFSGKREDVTLVEEQKTQTLPQGEATYCVLSAKNNGIENYYAVYLIDLPEQETFAWVMVSATPLYYKANAQRLHNYVCSLSSTKEC